MIDSLRGIKTRIASIGSIIKTTKAMEMVSLAKLRNLQSNVNVSRKYYNHLFATIRAVLSSIEDASHPLLEIREVKNKALCVVTSDTGLCGSYNNEILHMADSFLSKNNGRDTECYVIGKKGVSHFKAFGLNITESFTDFHGAYSESMCDKITEKLGESFLKKSIDEVYVAYTQFDPSTHHKPVIERFLPIEIKLAGHKENFTTEPGPDAFLDLILPYYMCNKMRNIMFNALASEHSSRVMSMKEASDNAKELMDDLILLRNKVRQANITGELIEVISSADALKG